MAQAYIMYQDKALPPLPAPSAYPPADHSPPDPVGSPETTLPALHFANSGLMEALTHLSPNSAEPFSSRYSHTFSSDWDLLSRYAEYAPPVVEAEAHLWSIGSRGTEMGLVASRTIAFEPDYPFFPSGSSDKRSLADDAATNADHLGVEGGSSGTAYQNEQEPARRQQVLTRPVEIAGGGQEGDGGGDQETDREGNQEGDHGGEEDGENDDRMSEANSAYTTEELLQDPSYDTPLSQKSVHAVSLLSRHHCSSQ